MTLTYTDSHCHLDWFADPAAVAAEAAAAGVARIVIAATTRAHWADVARCAALPGVYASYGLHPLYQNAHQDDDLHALENQIRTQPSVAIGECGLDFQNGDSAAQRATFAAQIDIARRHRLPLMLHARKSLDAVLHLLQRGGNPRFVIHSFTGSDVQLARIFAQGGYIGIGGTSTYPRAARLCGGYQRGFAGDGVDAVGEHVRRISRKPFARVAGVDEAVADGERELGVDVQQALAHDFGFFAAEGAVQCQQLAVEVGRRDGVVVEDNHLADAGAGDGFGAVAADTAEAGDEDGFVAQAVEAVVADEDLAAGVGCGHVRVTS